MRRARRSAPRRTHAAGALASTSSEMMPGFSVVGARLRRGHSPVALDRANIDPAVSSAVFVTTATDVMGFYSFLGLASLWALSA